ncbi:MAG: hypothetical protein A2041_00505 [Bacteroidetes bacterium GWA2_31_9b]|nr:MAG: hypothetical protein A2041_00505 [Bacteroidetes bacterium GWA2_31_9b]
MKLHESKKQDQLEILIIDNEQTNSDILTTALKEQGYSVRSVTNGTTALQYLTKKLPNLILLELNLPDISGFELCHNLKSDKKSCNIPVIFISVSNSKDEKIKAFEVGGVDFIIKPFEPAELFARIKSQLQLQSLTKKLEQEITDLKNKLKEREAKFHNLIEITSDWIWEVNTEGVYTFSNSRVKEILGYTPKQIVGKTPFNLMPEEEAEKLAGKFLEIINSKKPFFNLENINLHKNGKKVVLETSGVPYFDYNGSLMGYRGIDRDITKRKESEEQLRQKEHYYRSLLYNMHEDIIVIDSNYQITDVNNTFLVTSGHKREKVIGKHCYEISHGYNDPCYLHGEVCMLKEVFETGEPRNCYHIHKTIKDVDVHVDILLSPLKDDEGNVTHIIETVRNISDVFEAQEALKKSEEEYRSLFENTTIGIYRSTPEGKVLMANPALLMMMGCNNLNEFQRISLVTDFYTKKYPRSYFKKNLELYGEINGLESKWKKKDGNEIDIRQSAKIVRDSNGIAMYYEGWVEDITARKKAEKALLESEEKFRNLFNSSSDGIIITDENSNILAFNETLINSLGFNEEYVRNKKATDFIMPDQVDKVKQRIKTLYNNESLLPLEIDIYNAAGMPVSVEINSKIIEYENKRSVLSIIRNISDRKEAERKILNAVIETEEHEREKFAKDLHDGIGPLLSASKIYSKSFQLCENDEERSQTIQKLEETIDEAIQSVQEISNNLSPHILKNFGLKVAIESFLKKITDASLIKFTIGSNFEKRVSENIEIILYRVTVELINNTIKHSNANTIQIKLLQKENNLFLHYTDDGIGFNINETLNKSTGMGLSNIYSRIRSLDGDIVMDSSKNRGLSVKIRIVL